MRALRANVPVVQNQQDAARVKITDTVYQWLDELQILKGKDQQGKSEKTIKAYPYRLGFFLDFCVQRRLAYLDQTDRSKGMSPLPRRPKVKATKGEGDKSM